MTKHRYTVTVVYRTERRKNLGIFAHNEDEAIRRACDTVMAFDNVVEAEAEECRREAP